MKKWLLVPVLLLFMGCGMPTQQDYQNWTNTLDAVIPAVAALDNPKLDKIIGDVKIVRESVAEAKTLPEAVSKGIEASRSFNPYADEMNVGFVVITGLLGLFLKSKNAKYSAIKKGVNKFVAENENGRELYSDIGAERKAKGIS